MMLTASIPQRLSFHFHTFPPRFRQIIPLIALAGCIVTEHLHALICKAPLFPITLDSMLWQSRCEKKGMESRNFSWFAKSALELHRVKDLVFTNAIRSNQKLRVRLRVSDHNLTKLHSPIQSKSNNGYIPSITPDPIWLNQISTWSVLQGWIQSNPNSPRLIIIFEFALGWWKKYLVPWCGFKIRLHTPINSFTERSSGVTLSMAVRGLAKIYFNKLWRSQMQM